MATGQHLAGLAGELQVALVLSERSLVDGAGAAARKALIALVTRDWMVSAVIVQPAVSKKSFPPTVITAWVYVVP